MRNKWKVGDWKIYNPKNNWQGIKELKIKGTNIIVGMARPYHRNKNQTIVSGNLSNIKGTFAIIDKPFNQCTDNDLFTAWEKAFSIVDKKLLK